MTTTRAKIAAQDAALAAIVSAATMQPDNVRAEMLAIAKGAAKRWGAAVPDMPAIKTEA